MKYQGISLSKILQLENDRKFVLPNFQRGFVWDRKDQRSLAASFAADLPIGSVLIIDGESSHFAARTLCHREGDANPKNNCTYLLDGQQRISTLKAVFDDVFDHADGWEKAWDLLYPGLKNRWHIIVKPEADQAADLFGWRDLHYEASRKIDPREILPLLRCKKIYKGKKHWSSWFHPQFKPEDLEIDEDERRKQLVGEDAAEENAVPLWTVYSQSETSKPLHYWALRAIASRRRRELEAEAEGNPQRLVELLSIADPSIERHVRSTANSEEIADAWRELELNWVNDVRTAIEKWVDHQIPRTKLPSDEISRAVAVFENINKGGTDLSVFDLVVTHAALDATEKDSLRERVSKRLDSPIQIPEELGSDKLDVPDYHNCIKMGALDNDGYPDGVIQDQFLNLLSVIGHYREGSDDRLKVDHIKKAKQLQVEPRAINAHAIDVTTSLMRALAFLQIRCGIVELSDISYKLMILPIAYVLSDDSNWKSQKAIDKVEYWYWSSLFAGNYREYQNRQSVDDVLDLSAWVAGGENPFDDRAASVLESPEYSDRATLKLDEEDESNREPVRGPVANGLLQFILSQQPVDFLPEDRFAKRLTLSAWNAAAGQTFRDDDDNEYTLKLEKHHIIPLGVVTSMGENTKEVRKNKRHLLNSPLNYTYVSETANRLIRDMKPNAYLKQLQELTSVEHGIPPRLSNEVRDWASEDNWEEECWELYDERYDNLKNQLNTRLRKLGG
jgi:hypothetical protein